MKVLVTGASGFIGQKLVARLVAAGHDVRTFGRTQTQPPAFADLPVTHLSGSIARPDQIASAVSGSEVVFHLAGLVSYRQRDRQLQYETNVVGTRNVMQAASDAGVKRVIHTSSIAGMGVPSAGLVGDETQEYNLSGLGLGYCDTKYEAEQEALRFAAKGLPVIVLSPGIIFGEGDSHPHHHTIFLAMAKGWLLGWPAGGVTFCDINDVVEAHVNAITMGRPGERYVLGSANLTYREAAICLSEIMGSRPPNFEIPGWLIEGAAAVAETVMPLFGLKPALTRQVAWLCQRKIFYSNEKAVRELKMPVTPFAETVRRTAPYYLGLSGARLPGKASAAPATRRG